MNQEGIMAMCERCWRDAYMREMANTSKSQSQHYHDLIEERKDHPCTEDEQKGIFKQPPQAQTA
jgi:hypothetical protein